jgi:hypothetical protein
LIIQKAGAMDEQQIYLTPLELLVKALHRKWKEKDMVYKKKNAEIRNQKRRLFQLFNMISSILRLAACRFLIPDFCFD